MADIKNLRLDDQCYVLNSHQNSVAVAFVSQIDAQSVQVYLPGKEEHQWFDRETGWADVELRSGEQQITAKLLHPEDWRVAVIQTRKLFKAHLAGLRSSVDRLSQTPTGLNALRLSQAAASLESFVATADPVALRATSISDYLQLSKQ